LNAARPTGRQGPRAACPFTPALGGKRNQARSARRYYLGARYLREKQKNGGDRKSVHHSDGLITAERFATEEGVGKATVERAAKFAAQVDEMVVGAWRPPG
jgi:hypothetical protein